MPAISRMSHPSARSKPYPAAAPLMTPITGVSISWRITVGRSRVVEDGAPATARAETRARHGVLDVEARAEALAGPGEQDDPDVAVGVGRGQVLGQQLQHPDRDRVAPVGAVEGDGGDVVGHVVQDLGPMALVPVVGPLVVGGGAHVPTR